MKLCIDCKHHLPKRNIGYFYTVYIESYCARLATRNPVNGAVTSYKLPRCDAEREDALRLEQFRCKVDGIYWEKK